MKAGGAGAGQGGRPPGTAAWRLRGTRRWVRRMTAAIQRILDLLISNLSTKSKAYKSKARLSRPPQNWTVSPGTGVCSQRSHWFTASRSLVELLRMPGVAAASRGEIQGSEVQQQCRIHLRPRGGAAPGCTSSGAARAQAQSALFMMNNLHYMVKTVESSEALTVLGEEWIEVHKDQVPPPPPPPPPRTP